MHFADLLANLEAQVRRIADFLEISTPADAWLTIIHNYTFAEMKKHGEELMPQLKMILKGGGDSFFDKGTNGRWREILSIDELRLYDAAAERELSPDCRQWLQHSGES